MLWAAGKGRPSERVEDRHGVEVVAPVGDLAIGDREDRDVPVGERGPGRNDSAFGGVLEHHDAGLDVVMDREVVTSVEDDHRAVGAVELGDGLAALDVPWVAGSRDDVVEDDLFGQQVEEVPTIGDAIEALLDDAKERVECLEVVEVGDRRRHDGPPSMSTFSSVISGSTATSSSSQARTSKSSCTADDQSLRRPFSRAALRGSGVQGTAPAGTIHS